MYGSPKTLCNFQMQKEQRSKSDLSQTNRRYRIEISTVVFADLHKMIRLSGCNIGARRLRWAQKKTKKNKERHTTDQGLK